MEIKKVNGYEAQTVQKTTEQVQPRRVPADGVTGKDAQPGADQVQLSDRYQELARVRKVMMEREDLRNERIDHLRNLIQSKNYIVNPEKIAQKMLEELW